MMKYIQKKHTITEITNPNISTISYSDTTHLQMFPKDFFCAKNHGTGIIEKTTNTFCIHHFAMSWLPKSRTFLPNIKRKLITIFGVKTINTIINLFGLKLIKEKLKKNI